MARSRAVGGLRNYRLAARHTAQVSLFLSRLSVRVLPDLRDELLCKSTGQERGLFGAFRKAPYLVHCTSESGLRPHYLSQRSLHLPLRGTGSRLWTVYACTAYEWRVRIGELLLFSRKCQLANHCKSRCSIGIVPSIHNSVDHWRPSCCELGEGV